MSDVGPTIIIVGDVGAGKSTLVELITGEKGLSSDACESYTRASTFFWSSDGCIQIVDTPGANAYEDRLMHNLHIAYAMGYAPITRILVVVKADTRTDNTLAKIEEYAGQFADLGLELLAVCVTHMDTVGWGPEKLLPKVAGQGIDPGSVVFLGLRSQANYALAELQRLCKEPRTWGWRQPVKIDVTAELFLRCFKSFESNVRITRAVAAEVAEFASMTRAFKEQLKERTAKYPKDHPETVDLVFSFQDWIMSELENARGRLMAKCSLSMIGDSMLRDAAHLANFTNQVRGIVFEVRAIALNYQRDAGQQDIRLCPHCGVPWAKVTGCPDTTCGNPMRTRDGDGRTVFARFRFTWDGSLKKLHIEKNGERQISRMQGGQRGQGCGRRINWEQMQPFSLPKEVMVSRSTPLMEDVRPLRADLLAGVETVFRRTMESVQVFFSPPPRARAQPELSAFRPPVRAA